MDKPTFEQRRQFLKDTIRLEFNFSETDQALGVAPPPIEKPFAPDAVRIDLVKPQQWDVDPLDLESAIRDRQSRRSYSQRPLSLSELSFLLWATQGIRQRLDYGTALRTVPSAGARHALETYLCIFRVEGVEPGFYRYLPLEHQLLLEFHEARAKERIIAATLGQIFVAESAVTFFWTAVPYRMEWRYGPAAHKAIALDAGHVCQNLYLACEVIGAGTCAVAAYHQQLIDQLLQLDGTDEFVIYLAAVGKL